MRALVIGTAWMLLAGLVGACDEGEAGAPLTAEECAQYPSCSVNTTCAQGECIAIDNCSTAICIDSDTACRKRCGSKDCAILESYPAQIACEGAESQPRTCDDVKAEWDQALAAAQSCTTAEECGQVLEGSSCGCTRNLVLRNDADATTLNALMNETVNGAQCIANASTCDCPEADGFACLEGRCTWNYLPQ